MVKLPFVDLSGFNYLYKEISADLSSTLYVTVKDVWLIYGNVRSVQYGWK